jgi:hypothetical protein
MQTTVFYTKFHGFFPERNGLPWERVSTGNTQWQAEEKARAAVHGRSGQILVLSEADSRHTASYPK